MKGVFSGLRRHSKDPPAEKCEEDSRDDSGADSLPASPHRMKNPFGPFSSGDAVENQKHAEFEETEDDSRIAQREAMKKDHGDLQ
jgi:hypothetical protein